MTPQTSQKLGLVGIPPTNTYSSINVSFLCVGIIQLLLGICTIVFQFVATYSYDRWGPNSFNLIPMPIAIVYIVTGGVAIGAYRKQGSKCLVLATLVMSVIASLAACIQIYWRVGSQFYNSSQFYTRGLLYIGFLEWIFSITQSALCCKGITCKQDAPIVLYQQLDGSQLVVLPNGHKAVNTTGLLPGLTLGHAGQTDFLATRNTKQPHQFYGGPPPWYISIAEPNQSGSVVNHL